MKKIISAIMAITCVAVHIGTAQAQVTYGTIASVSGGGGFTTLTPSNSQLYGTSQGGGAYSAGFLYKVTSSNTIVDIHDFSSSDGMGYSPYGPLVVIGQTLYGLTTMTGGTNSSISANTTMFKIGLDGSGYVALCALQGTNGYRSSSGLIRLAGAELMAFVTINGGANGRGTVNVVNTNGVQQWLVSLDTTNGSAGWTLTQGTNGMVYIATTMGGAGAGGGVICEVNTATHTIINRFPSTATINSFGWIGSGPDGRIYTMTGDAKAVAFDEAWSATIITNLLGKVDQCWATFGTDGALYVSVQANTTEPAGTYRIGPIQGTAIALQQADGARGNVFGPDGRLLLMTTGGNIGAISLPMISGVTNITRSVTNMFTLLTATAIHGQQYDIQVATNLPGPWYSLGNVTASWSSLNYTDSATAPITFYRIVQTNLSGTFSNALKYDSLPFPFRVTSQVIDVPTNMPTTNGDWNTNLPPLPTFLP